MSNYTKLTAYDTKDALSTGDPLKRVKGTELDDEFDAIATAIATKADNASPTFSGTPIVPTASLGTNTTQAASTAFVQAALAAMYPVGTVYTNISVSTNPATLLGFGTWVAIAGRVVVGLDASNAAFDTAGETGGSADAIVVAHTHTGTTNGQSASHTHTVTTTTGTVNAEGGGGIGVDIIGASSTSTTTSSQSADHNHGFTTGSTGSSATNANLQPYVVAYVWKRTA
jgi:hypothetical protein